jgi:hypothetical protein
VEESLEIGESEDKEVDWDNLQIFVGKQEINEVAQNRVEWLLDLLKIQFLGLTISYI